MAKTDLTAQRLRELLHYDPETGIFTARADFVGKGCRRRAGNVVGTKHNRGYWHIRIGDHRYLAHRLAWLYMTGAWPEQTIDHMNGDKLDNRWSNLRDVSHTVNMQNMYRPFGQSKSGRLGVAWASSINRWIAQINANGVYRHIGSFTCPKLAEQAYLEAKRLLHAEAMQGRPTQGQA